MSVCREGLTTVDHPQPLRLALVTPRFWPLIGDASTHVLRLAEALALGGHEIRVVSALWRQSWPRQMMVGPVPLVRLRGSPRSGWSTLRWMYSLGRWLRDEAERLDGVLVAGMRHEAYVAIRQLEPWEPSGKPVILMAGEGDLAWHQTATFGRRMADRSQGASLLVASSQAQATDLVAAGFAESSIAVVPRSVPIAPSRNPIRREEARVALATANHDLVTTKETPVVIAAGRFDSEHRFGDLVRAWRIVSATRRDARLWILGDGPERDRLYRQVGDLDLRFRVLLPGTFDSGDEVLQAADLVVAPAAHAAPPLALLEAMAAGLPAVAADGPGIREALEPDQTGLVFPAGEVKPLAEAILRLIQNPAEGVRLGAAARERMRAAPDVASEAARYVALFSRLREARVRAGA